MIMMNNNEDYDYESHDSGGMGGGFSCGGEG
jgi:hypothetical protein